MSLPPTDLGISKPTGWRAFFGTDPSASGADILGTIADRFSLEITFRDGKEVVGAGQPQVRFVGKGVILPNEEYLKGAEHLCRRYETLFIADEIQTGIGRTGKFLAGEHWSIEPDMVLLAKALSGGHVPVGAVLMRKWVSDKVFNRKLDEPGKKSGGKVDVDLSRSYEQIRPPERSDPGPTA